MASKPGEALQRHPIAPFCTSRLAEDRAEQGSSRDRHAAYYAAYIERFRDDLRGGKQREALLQLEDELENLRLAWLWLAERGDGATLYAMTHPLYNFYNYRGCYSEGSRLSARSTSCRSRQLEQVGKGGSKTASRRRFEQR
ncbi:MAG: hypothetical protein U5L04_14965 [Trueperaceae bacterium]|nr:hypothetical protein [Trueperaceae bacterium]